MMRRRAMPISNIQKLQYVREFLENQQGDEHNDEPDVMLEVAIHFIEEVIFEKEDKSNGGT